MNTKSKFIDKCTKNFNSFYDYFLVKLKSDFSYNKKVTIICSKHESWNQRASKHMDGQGCPICAHHVSKPEIAWLDSLGIPLKDRQYCMTIGDRRFNFDAFHNGIIYEFDGDYFHGNPEIYEPHKINQVNKKTFGQLYAKTLDKYKFLEDKNFTIIKIWESEFLKLYKAGLANSIMPTL